MPRKSDGFLYLMSQFPWWVSTTIAFVGYIAFAHVLPLIHVENQFVGAALSSVQRHSHILGIMVAIVFLGTAAVSFFKSFTRRRQLDRQESIESIRNLSWREFEEVVAEAFRRDGYKVTENQSAGADGGVDVRLRKEGKRYLVQCKNWQRRSVGVKVVREMYGVLTDEDAEAVFIVCSGGFTSDAIRFAQGKPIHLLGGDALLTMVERVRGDASQEIPDNSKVEDQESHEAETRCPRCGGQLVVRRASRGSRKGRQFLGCTAFPRCRYTIDVPLPDEE